VYTGVSMYDQYVAYSDRLYVSVRPLVAYSGLSSQGMSAQRQLNKRASNRRIGVFASTVDVFVW
jgi:hypothetical protein